MGALDVLEDFYAVDPRAFDGAGLDFDVRAPDPDDEPKTVRAMLDEKGPADGPRWPRFHDLVAGKPAKGLEDPDDESARDFHIGLSVASWLHRRSFAINGAPPRVLGLDVAEDEPEIAQAVADAVSYCRAQRRDPKGKARDARYLSRTAARVIQAALSKIEAAEGEEPADAEGEEPADGSANFRGERGTAEEVAFEPLAAIESRELAPFPVDALGEVGDFVRALAATTQTPPDLAGVAALGFLAGAVARKAIVRAGWDEEIALYVAAVAEPGSRKSEVWKQCARPVEACESELREAAAPIIRENEAKLALLKKRLGRIETNYANAEDAEGRREAEREAIELRAEIAAVSTAGAPRLLVADVTPERLANLVAQNDERMILASAEGGQIFDRMFRYSQNGDPNMDLVLSGWSGERCSIDRQNAESIILKRPVLTIVGAIQQHVLESLSRQTAFEGRGLTARFAYSIPKDNRGYRDTRAVVPMDCVASQQYAQTMDRLLQMEHDTEAPLVLAVVGEALELFGDFRQFVEIEQREGGRFEDVRGWASKAPGLVLRIAGVLALADARWGARPAISPEIMRRAIDLGAYFADHSKRAFEIMAGDTGDRALDKLWRWIARRETPGADFTRQEAWQGTKGGRFKVGADLDGPLDRLARAGRIARRPAAKESAGRPAAVWAVNPEALR